VDSEQCTVDKTTGHCPLFTKQSNLPLPTSSVNGINPGKANVSLDATY